jgi:hypothetical protein
VSTDGTGQGYLYAGLAVVADSEQVVRHLDRLGLALVIEGGPADIKRHDVLGQVLLADDLADG